ncbi:hypothetical protein HLH34_11205 [Gluconacetobacter azotocaptans]|uniref:DUF6680 domain-containing protein n=1 Tax=Gluconacetobacter azotocaptans TaxID=142834 RepID=A0A7W4JTD6_9PROT|nr:DUF6680 family protein [Gluconacetobacter azotocaptans]MBB2190524.1 hypothetical protein [Gluconacetobacter azotocaptans]GBQ28448.1 hypothetical protein AA13594_0991 [Gluconacetobacter azotocaptans DSM 13594]
MSWNDPAVIAAGLSAIAAVAAAIATWRAPLSAAKMAETLRRVGDIAQDVRRFKLNIFTTIMQARATIYADDSVRALNSIDVAFAHSTAVREAWAELFQALGAPNVPPHVMDERIRKLLREMAIDLGIADQLRMDDFSRVYYPNALQQQRQIEDLQRREALARLTGQAQPAANTVTTAATTTAIGSPWPPPPDASTPGITG